MLAGLIAFITQLVPDPSRSASVELLAPDPVTGLGVQVRLDGTAQTVREGTFGLIPAGVAPTADDRKTSRYGALMLPAAVWLAYEAAPEPESFGTRSWRSYAHAVVGAPAHLNGDLDAAEARYRAALAEDPNNDIARYNLGSLLLVPRKGEAAGSTEEHDRLALVGRLLAPLYASLEGPEERHRLPHDGRDGGAPPLLIAASAAYLDAIRCLYTEDYAGSRHRIVLLDSTLATERKRLGGAGAPARDRLAGLRRDVEPVIPLLQATVAMLSGQPYRVPEIGDGHWRPDVHYAFACFHARRAHDRQRDPAAAADEHRIAAGHLRAALGTGDPLLRRSAQTDPAFAGLRASAAWASVGKLVDDATPSAPKPERHDVVLHVPEPLDVQLTR